MKDNKEQPINEEQRKGISRYRLSWLFIILFLIAIGYLIYEIVILTMK